MLPVDGHPEDLGPPAGPEASPPPARKVGVPWAWTLIACALLGASGVVRAVQDRRHDDERSYVEACPIALDAMPKKMGAWRLVEDGDRKLDEDTMRITGGTDHFMRVYADDLTGVTLVVLLLFGPAQPVLPHTPDICYPSSGYANVDGPSDASVKFRLGQDAQGRPVDGQAQFRTAVYQKSTGRAMSREAVYHSFRLDGRWSPDIGTGRKIPRRNPGVFKIQIQRQVAAGETLGKGDPIEQFLAILLAELEKEIKDASGKKIAAKSS